MIQEDRVQTPEANTPWGVFSQGIFKENPILIQLLGMCPTLAITNTVENAIGMGLATTFVLGCSNLFVSLLKKIIPYEIRIPGYIIIIATFVTVVDIYMRAFFPELSVSLGAYIPLIVANCLLLGRAEVFAAKRGPIISIVDGVGMGIGFTCGLMLVASVREILGSGMLLGWTVLPATIFTPWMMMVLPPGAFFALGFIIVIKNKLTKS